VTRGPWGKTYAAEAFDWRLRSVSERAALFWFLCRAWCVGEESDGLVPAGAVTMLGGDAGAVEELTRVGLATSAEAGDVRLAWDGQRTAAEAAASRTWETARKARQRACPTGTTGGTPPGVPVVSGSEREKREDQNPVLTSFVLGGEGGNAVTVALPTRDAAVSNGAPDPTRPDPTSPDTSQPDPEDWWAPPPKPPEPTKVAKVAKRVTVKTVCPADWQPTDEHRALARSLGVDADREADAMRDWSAANDARKADWGATYRNWLRTAATRQNGSQAPLRAGSTVSRLRAVPTPDWIQRDGMADEMTEAEEAAYRRAKGWDR